jgi:hypothetical protein
MVQATTKDTRYKATRLINLIPKLQQQDLTSRKKGATFLLTHLKYFHF